MSNFIEAITQEIEERFKEMFGCLTNSAIIFCMSQNMFSGNAGSAMSYSLIISPEIRNVRNVPGKYLK